MKTCSQCKSEKELEQFSKDKRFRDGRRPECKMCEHKRPSYYLKSIRYRVKNLKWYEGIENRLTVADIEQLPSECYFCHKPIQDGMSIHRINHDGHYEFSNVAKVHKSCHAKYGGHTTARNPRKGFGSMPRDKVIEIGDRGRRNRLLNIRHKKVAG